MNVDRRRVSLTIPAKADYVVLARLALSAICRLTPLPPDDVADLKLAVTEAATGVVGRDPRRMVSFEFRVEDERLVLKIDGPGGRLDEEERELARAIMAATVDEHSESDGRISLVKYLQPVE